MAGEFKTRDEISHGCLRSSAASAACTVEIRDRTIAVVDDEEIWRHMDDWVLELVLRDRLHEPVVPWPEMNLDEPGEG